ncbi:MAG TPA: glycoside hydrolase family 2 TIM barrel-domain containing protein [Candidatus Dormibacteraeota bacterium]|nr:glycoside hydrolase family 2 TIM barrel-domain containing protein [Candidatus Dormibacteraeota bacterium]
MRLARRFAGFVLVNVVLGLLLPACVSPEAAAELTPTLSMRSVGGSRIAFQNGIPVPTFSYEPRRRLELSSHWRIQTTPMDHDLSLAVRSQSLARIVAEAAGRERPAFDDTRWSTVEVPGSYDPPPAVSGNGAWYRKDFDVPADWQNQTVTLKFGAANYVADVWLNGHYLGYHEGGSTPFAFDATDAIVPGDINLIAVRIDNPPWGTRQDIVPWGLTDWWNYSGLTQPVWMEATPAVYAVRADVVPHLDSADIAVTLHQRGGAAAPVQVGLDILPAAVDPSNVTNPDPLSLVPPGAVPIASQRVDAGQLGRDGTSQVHARFSLTNADLWSPQSPALYVLEVHVFWQERRVDQLVETFGLRRIAVDAKSPRLLLNGNPVQYAGVALHDERVYPSDNGQPRGGPVVTPDDILILLDKANATNVQLIRADHHPANPLLLMLADRLGYAIWEEIPLYHYTPATFAMAMDRGIPQQMLSEMDLRDMNHPSVLFHGLANESTGGSEREQALATLHNLDRSMDGTRLTGQAAYGNQPDDQTSRPLDVAGYTTYFGVFYGADAAAGTVRALQVAHATFPKKPIIILEFGRWSDNVAEQEEQRRILADTYQAVAPYLDDIPNGFVGATVWWTLDDYWTQRPGLKVEHFGLYAPNGDLRAAGRQAAQLFSGGAGQGANHKIVSTATGQTEHATTPGLRFLRYLAYALTMALTILTIILLSLLLLRRRPRRQAAVS